VTFTVAYIKSKLQHAVHHAVQQLKCLKPLPRLPVVTAGFVRRHCSQSPDYKMLNYLDKS
jgi:hypothetical protein